MLKPMPDSGKIEADKVMREFFDYRFQSVEERIDRLSSAFEKLSEAIITRAAFDELSRDVVAVEERLNNAEKRVRNLEEQVRFARWTLAAVGVVLVPLVTDWLRGFLP